MRLGSVSDAAGPSGHPEIGGSGSPAPSTTRPGDAGCRLPEVGDGAEAVEGVAALLADAELGSTALLKGAGGVFGAACAKPDARLPPVVGGVEPMTARSGDVAPVDPSGGGCGGRPAATRWRAAEASALSGGADGSAEVAMRDDWSSRSASDGSGVEAAGETPGSGGSRPLSPGGVFPEFTADTPRRRAP